MRFRNSARRLATFSARPALVLLAAAISGHAQSDTERAGGKLFQTQPSSIAEDPMVKSLAEFFQAAREK